MGVMDPVMLLTRATQLGQTGVRWNMMLDVKAVLELDLIDLKGSGALVLEGMCL